MFSKGTSLRSIFSRNYSPPARAQQLPHRDADIIIVGAGVAGCSAAVAFGKQGRRVILFEKSIKEPNRISGELLQPGGVKALKNLGLGGCLKGIGALPCYGYCVFYNNESAKVPYPKSADIPGTREEGCLFQHGIFVQRLRHEAMQTPNVTVIESRVNDVIRDWQGNRVLGVITKAASEERRYQHYFASLILISDGYASTFRKRFLPNKPSVESKFWGLKLFGAELPFAHYGHVLLSSNPPVLLYKIDKATTRIFVDVPAGLESASSSAGGIRSHMLNTVLPMLPRGCQQSFQVAVERGKFLSMPNCYMPDSEQTTPGLMILGDAMNMRHPLTGAGMTVALKDVLLVSGLLSPDNVPSLEDSAAVLRAIKKFHKIRKSSSSVINILAMSLYPICAATDPTLSVLKYGLFRYFQRGGWAVEESCGMLAGLVDNVAVLEKHVLAVLFYSIWLRLSEVPFWKKPWVLGVEAFTLMWQTIVLLGPYLAREIRG
ncbi:squalene epoxidase-domain-containing protein [Aspergillus ambiguus]|uniref:squalene epoxidase-domain-containing protein n=1 Tax=Aspergillus ambiguus TaxID=176160 RepID=UPI003CCDD910